MGSTSVADSSLQTDRDIKIPLYAFHAIPEVWIVAIPERQVLRFAHPLQGVYQRGDIVSLNQPTQLPGLPGYAVDLAGLF
ncbi:Uma2 family endonuclease [Thiorhodospira sibirica]|uniref:Uma2 family endonuclease n=1 Tax=Thiorhodospira sibirica TaxID=154347 RepID=UPI00022C4CAB